MDFNRFFEGAADNSPVTKKDLDEFGRKILEQMKSSEQKILKEMEHNQKSVKRAMTRVLQETKQRTSSGQKRRGELLLKNPFDDLNKFQNFEKEVQDHGSKYETLKDELSTVMAHTAEKFVRNAWRKLLTDGVAQQLCWKGTKEKKAVRALSVTSALKSTFSSKFPHSTDADFERTSIGFFQHAKGRYTKKKEYKENTSSNKKD